MYELINKNTRKYKNTRNLGFQWINEWFAWWIEETNFIMKKYAKNQ